MAEKSNIQWTDSTFNPWIGCTKVSAGCANCYAETEDKRRHWTPEGWGKGKERKRTSEAYWKQPLTWNREAEKTGVRRRVFCASLADVFDAEVPNEWRLDLFNLIRRTPMLDWQLLTKRTDEMARFMGALAWRNTTATERNEGKSGPQAYLWDGHPAPPLDNVWLGTSVEDQKAADKRIPELLKIPAKVRFLSCEPLLGAVDLSDMWLGSYWDANIQDPMNGRKGSFVAADTEDENGIHWVICGGESGFNARAMHHKWARSLRDQCVAAGVAFHFKQWGEWLHSWQMEGIDDATATQWHASLSILRMVWPDSTVSFRVGKKKAGRLLDGRTWDELPRCLTCGKEKLTA